MDRHFLTPLNRIQGWCDSPLTEKGREQARQVRAYFEKHDTTFDQYYCTTTERASDTIELATGRTDYKRVKGLKEMHFGIFEGQPEYLHPKTSVVGHFGGPLCPVWWRKSRSVRCACGCEC